MGTAAIIDASAAARPLRIGEVAELTGVTPRTIRYWEQIGLLPAADERETGKHRLYETADVERIGEIVRLKELLGLSLEQLSGLLAAESARAKLRRAFAATEDPVQQRRILTESRGHLTRQLALVRERQAQINRLQGDLEERLQRVEDRLEILDAG